MRVIGRRYLRKKGAVLKRVIAMAAGRRPGLKLWGARAQNNYKWIWKNKNREQKDIRN